MMRRRALVGIGIALLAWAGLAGVTLVRVALDLRTAKAATERARNLSRFTDVADGRPIPELHLAAQRFSRARDNANGRALLPVRVFPILGRQLRSVATLSNAASQIAMVGEGAMREGGELLRRPSGSSAERVALVTALGVLAERTRTRLLPVSLGPRKGLLSPLARARNQVADDLAEVKDQLQRGSIGAKSVALLLGGPRRYLVFAGNNSEMRAGSGMFLSVGMLEVDSAGLRLGQMRSVVDVDVPSGAVPLEGDLADRWGWLEPNREWRNLMTSPRFDAAAPLAAAMWTAAGNPPVDGVMTLDPVTLGQILEATGPVTVDGRQFDKDSVVDELLHGQYLRFNSGERSERQEQLGRLAGAAFAAVDSGGVSVPALASGLARSAGGRHLMLWASRPDEEAGWAALRADGSLQSNSLMVSVVNRAGNKLDRFLNIASDISFARKGSDSEVTLRVTLRNDMPAGEPPYVMGSEAGTGVEPGSYLGILTVDLPGAARNGRIDGVEHLAVAGADGPTRVIGYQIELDPGAERTVLVRFLLPAHTGAIRVEPSARVPPTAWTGPTAHWQDKSAKNLVWRAT